MKLMGYVNRKRLTLGIRVNIQVWWLCNTFFIVGVVFDNRRRQVRGRVGNVIFIILSVETVRFRLRHIGRNLFTLHLYREIVRNFIMKSIERKEVNPIIVFVNLKWNYATQSKMASKVKQSVRKVKYLCVFPVPKPTRSTLYHHSY